ncbi:MAG: TauD/TfdA dioxygenase family protein [Pseudomonadales bacterium]
MDIRRLTPHIGADLVGVDLARLDAAGFAEIYAAWLEHQVIRVRGQSLSDAALQDFSARFGPLEKIPLGKLSDDEARARGITNLYVTVLSNIRVDGKAIGGLGNSEAAWHSDMSYIDNPPTASVLYSVEIPAEGGNTHFASQYAAFEALPAGLKTRIAGLSIKHDAAHTSVGELRPGYSPFSDPREAPGAVHPIVREHPETGRRALFLGRREWAYVVGLPLAESETLLDELWRHAARPEFVLTQEWAVGDVIVWDNRCTLHRRDEFDQNSRRLLKRCQVLAPGSTARGEPAASAGAY